MPFRKGRSWIRWLGLAAVPFIIASSILGLPIGLTGLCVAPGAMDDSHPTLTLCLFFCGALVGPAMLLVALWLVFATPWRHMASVPLSPPRSIFHPPLALAA